MLSRYDTNKLMHSVLCPRHQAAAEVALMLALILEACLLLLVLPLFCLLAGTAGNITRAVSRDTNSCKHKYSRSLLKKLYQINKVFRMSLLIFKYFQFQLLSSPQQMV